MSETRQDLWMRADEIYYSTPGDRRDAAEVVYRAGYADALREVLNHLGQGFPDGEPMREVREFAAERGIDLESDDDA